MLAIATGLHDTVGIDLVAMCVNDLVVQGAEPLFFLDYFATGKLDRGAGAGGDRRHRRGLPARPAARWSAARRRRCPGCIGGGDYDLAGFAVGAAERDALLPRGVAPGDVVLGLASSGLHSNAFSLVRRVVAAQRAAWDAPAPFAPAACRLGAGAAGADADLCAAAAGAASGGAAEGGGAYHRRRAAGQPAARAAGGHGRGADAGLAGAAGVRAGWRATGGIAPEEMLRVFNCGIGMAVVVADADVAAATALLREQGETVMRIGHIEAAAARPRCGSTCAAGRLRVMLDADLTHDRVAAVSWTSCHEVA